MDEENVYVIRLTKDSELNPTPSFVTVLPSEQRSSSSLVCGLGCVHIILGVLAASFTILALFVDPEPHIYAAGLWTGVIYLGCGLLGVLAHARWYVRNQIFWFLLASILAATSAIAAIGITGKVFKRKFYVHESSVCLS